MDIAIEKFTADAGTEQWEVVEGFKHLEMKSKYFKGGSDEFEHVVRYDDGTVGCNVSEQPRLESNAEAAQSVPVQLDSAPPRLHVVFDSETTGLHEPHVVQLAYIVFTEDGTEVKRYNRILKLLPGKRIDPRAVEVHRINMSKVAREGVDPVEELNAFLRVCGDAIVSGGRVIAHNSKFDVRAVNTTLSAWEASPALMDEASTFCTMKQTKIHSPLVDRAGRKKPFKNAELHTFLFGREPDLGPLHDALTDILVTKANYLECVKRGWF
jgi:DNA polymerase III epsilon subunit-like protein